MTCRTCGAEIPQGGKFCPNCGASADSDPGATQSSGAFDPGATRIFENSSPRDDLESTRLFEAQDLGKTMIFMPQEKRKPIFGWLVVIEGPDAWEEFRIFDEEGQLILGKGGECQLKLRDEALEGMHASFRLKEGRLSITDLDTLGGTLVNDTPITKTDLQDGDLIKVGGNVLKFRKC